MSAVKVFVSGRLSLSASVQALVVVWRGVTARLYFHKNEWGFSVLVWNGAVSVSVGAVSLFVGWINAENFCGVGFSLYPFDEGGVHGSVYFSVNKWFDFPRKLKY